MATKPNQEKNVTPATHDAIDLMSAPEWSGEAGQRLSITPLHLTVRDAGFGKFLVLHGVDKNGELVAFKVIGTLLTDRFRDLSGGNPNSLVGRQFTIANLGKATSATRNDKDGEAVEYNNWLVVEGDGTQAAATPVDFEW